jgi:hypothetical protein
VGKYDQKRALIMAPISETAPKAIKAVFPATSAVSGAAGTYWVLTKVGIASGLSEGITLVVFIGTLAKAYGWIDDE